MRRPLHPMALCGGLESRCFYMNRCFIRFNVCEIVCVYMFMCDCKGQCRFLEAEVKGETVPGGGGPVSGDTLVLWD